MTAWISGNDVQAWLGSDKIDLTSADSLAQVASDVLRDYLERDLELQSSISEVYDTNGTNYVLLNFWPVRSITSVLLNSQTIQHAAPNQQGYLMDSFNPRKLKFALMGSLPRGEQNLSISYSAGYDVTQPAGSATGLPGTVYQALKLTAAAIFNSQAADPNLASESTAGVFSGSFYPTGVGAVPPGARTLLVREIRVSP